MRLLLLAFLAAISQARISWKLTADDITKALDELVLVDENGGGEDDVVVDYQNMASHKDFDHDNAPKPLITSVNSLMLAGSTFQAFNKLFALYTTPDTNTADPYSSDRTAAANAFIEAIFPTKVIQSLLEIASKAGLMSSDTTTFKKQLFDIWFTPFSRGSVAGSSSFESVFVGETNEGDVVGLSNWYGYYIREQADQVNYHGWFTREKGVQLELQFAWGEAKALIDSFLIGTSPEFDIAAYTLCGLSGLSPCSYTNDGRGVSLEVTTRSEDGKTLIDSVYPSSSGSGTATTKSSGKKTTEAPVVDSDLQKLVDAMRAADVDKPVNYTLNWGNKREGTTDTSPDPLYTYCDETIFERPIYKALIDIYNNNIFTPDVCTGEGAISGTRKQLMDKWLDTYANTTVFQLAYKHLQDLGLAGDWATFRPILFTLWFGRYTRCKGPLGSSGWEHVFCGELKSSTVDGQHDWVRYYREEKAGKINYHGYISYDDQLTGTFQYTWENAMKKIGGFNLGTSPVFDFSIFTVCVMAHTGAQKCQFKIDGFPIWVTSYKQACAEGGTCISTVYPSDS